MDPSSTAVPPKSEGMEHPEPVWTLWRFCVKKWTPRKNDCQASRTEINRAGKTNPQECRSLPCTANLLLRGSTYRPKKGRRSVREGGRASVEGLVPGWPLLKRDRKETWESVRRPRIEGGETYHSTTDRHVSGIHDEQRARVEPPAVDQTGRGSTSEPTCATQR